MWITKGRQQRVLKQAKTRKENNADHVDFSNLHEINVQGEDLITQNTSLCENNIKEKV